MVNRFGCGIVILRAQDATGIAMTALRPEREPLPIQGGTLAGGRDPMDFSAWFEVDLADRGRAFDARHDRPRIRRRQTVC